MIYTSARYLTPAPYTDASMVEGKDAEGRTETVRRDHRVLRVPEIGIEAFLASGGTIAPYVEPVPFATPAQPSLFAAVALSIEDGSVTAIEQAAQFGQIIYDDGWLMAIFAGFSDSSDYMVFAQPDIPARVEQFKSEGGFELVFSDPATGDPVNPNRIDIQILKVR